MGPETRLEGCSRNRTEEGVGGNEWPVTSDVAFRRFFDLTVFPKNRAAMLKGDGGVLGERVLLSFFSRIDITMQVGRFGSGSGPGRQAQA